MSQLKLYAVTLLLLTGISGLSVQAQNTTPDNPTLSKMFSCRQIEDSSARLACYDLAVGKFEAASTSGEVVTVTRPDVEKIKRDAFGFNIPSLFDFGNLFGRDESKQASKASVDKKSPFSLKNPFKSSKPTGFKSTEDDRRKIILKIARTKKIGYDKLRFYFENGQVWEQTVSKQLYIKKSGKTEAHIIKASLGSFLLRVNGSGPAINVRRVK
ncbi:MAG: hypothetical protein JKX72_12300 [Robiginitomaculum sp.]|nr:hypothetical protein [Robiginitomaculum sp.]